MSKLWSLVGNHTHPCSIHSRIEDLGSFAPLSVRDLQSYLFGENRAGNPSTLLCGTLGLLEPTCKWLQQGCTGLLALLSKLSKMIPQCNSGLSVPPSATNGNYHVVDFPELGGSLWGFRVNENMLGSILGSQFALPRVPKYVLR